MVLFGPVRGYAPCKDPRRTAAGWSCTTFPNIMTARDSPHALRQISQLITRPADNFQARDRPDMSNPQAMPSVGPITPARVRGSAEPRGAFACGGAARIGPVLLLPLLLSGCLWQTYQAKPLQPAVTAERLTTKPLIASPEEQEANPRARSAKLRAVRFRTD